MVKYKVKLKRNMAEALSHTIATIFDEAEKSKAEKDDYEKMLLAELADIRIKIEMKLYNVTDKYSFSFTPAQACALRVLHTDYVYDRTTYLGNKLMMMANEIHQQFS